MEYQINFGFHAFSVPSAVVDNLINFADGNSLKILLYLLRYPDKHFSAGQAASALKLSKEAAEEAFEFWSKANILKENLKEKAEEKPAEKQLELFPSVFSVPVPDPEPVPEPLGNPVLPEVPAQPKPKQNTAVSSDLFAFFSHESIHEMIAASPELEKLIRIAEEKYYLRPLNTVQLDSVVWMHEYLELPSEVILMLFQYCLDTKEKLNAKYINSIASEWWENGIVTPEAAEERINELKEYYTYQNYICRLFKISAISQAQQEIIRKWQEWQFSEEMLCYAHEISIEATGKRNNLKYMDKILTEWYETQITELEEAKQKREEHAQEIRDKNKKRGRKKKTIFEKDDVKRQEMEEIDEYLSLVNRFEEDIKT